MTQHPVFVFGSNLAGRHGAGAALFAKCERGAIYGRGVGFQGGSYAIPTKDERIRPMALPLIRRHVRQFIEFAKANPDLQFQLTPIGCGLAGNSYGDIAPMFIGCPANVIIPDEFKPILDKLDSSRARV